MNFNLTSIKVIKSLFKRYQIYPSKKFGQNFLISQRGLQKIIRAANLGPEDIVLEIGPGLGTLTQELAKRAKKVIAIEKDPKMIEILKETLKSFKNVKVLEKDVLKIPSLALIPELKSKGERKEKGGYKIVANLPYYITSPVIRKFLEAKNQPKLMVLMVQKEVGQRICGQPPKMNLLAVSVQFYAKPKIISYLSKRAFWPQPKVDSAIIKITPLPKTPAQAFDKLRVDLFFKIVKAGFSQPRKQIANNLSKGLKLNKKEVETWLWKNHIQPQQRAETLTIRDWLKLVQNMAKKEPISFLEKASF